MASVIFSDSYYISWTGTINSNVRLTFSENYSSSTNKTTLTLSKLEFQYVGNTTNWGIFNILGNIKVNNTTIATIDNTSTGKKATVTINDGNYHEADLTYLTITPITVEHNTDGTKKVNVELINGYTQDGMNFFCAHYLLFPNQFPLGVRAPVTKEMSLTTHAYTLTTQANDSSYGTVTAGGSLAPTATKSLTATPAATTAQYTYAFSSWSKTAGTLSSTTTNPTTFTMGTSNATVTANFTRTLRSYTVTCEDRIGSSTGTKLGTKTATYNYGSSVSGASFGNGTAYDLYYTGYHYIGSSSATTVTGATTVYRYFALNTWTVSYDANGGINAPSSQTKYYNTTLTLTSSKPTKGNDSAGSYSVICKYNYTGTTDTSLSAALTNVYTFSKWNTAANGSGTNYNSGGNYTANTAVTLYAQWSKTVSTASVTLPNPTRTGYTFNGWYNASSGGSKIADGGASYTPTAAITLYAHWTANNYTLTVIAGDYISSVSGGGSKACDSSVTVTAVLGSATGYTYSFDGWYNGNTRVSTSLSYTFNMGAANITLTAKGKRSINSYTVSLTKGNYISSVSGGGSKEYNSSVTVTAVLDSLTGYTYSFDGWYEGTTRKSTSLSYTFTMGASNISLTAKGSRSVNSYILSISQGTGSTISVSRTSSPNQGAATGTLINGATIFYGDVLSVSFSANTGYNITSRTINGTNVNATVTHTVTSAVNIVSVATLKTYTLSVSTSAIGATTSINRLTSPIGGGSIGTITNGATLYYNDTLAISYTIGGAYQLLTATVNSIDISSQTLPYNITVNNNIIVNVIVKLGAIVYLGNEAYQVFIGDGVNWVQYQAYIGNGTTYDQY